MFVQGGSSGKFESLVSFEGCKTHDLLDAICSPFESLVSFEGCKTIHLQTPLFGLFESLVSFEGCKTNRHCITLLNRLRVL